MFDNVHRKIKGISKVFLGIGIATSSFTGIAYIAAQSFNRQAPSWLAVVIGLLIIGLGSFSSWIVSVFLYGFGEIVECYTMLKNTITESNERKTNVHLSKQSKDEKSLNETLQAIDRITANIGGTASSISGRQSSK